MKRILLPLLAALLVTCQVQAAGRSGGGFGGRSTYSRPTVTRSYSRPSVRPSPPRQTVPRVRARPTVRVPSTPARPSIVVVRHTTYSSAYPYLIGGYYYAQPTSAPVVRQAADTGTGWLWFLLVLVLIVMVVVWSRRRR